MTEKEIIEVFDATTSGTKLTQYKLDEIIAMPAKTQEPTIISVYMVVTIGDWDDGPDTKTVVLKYSSDLTDSILKGVANLLPHETTIE